MLHLMLKRGNPDHLDGRVTVYAMIDIDPADLIAMKHPIASAIHNGFLVAQGNFRDQNSLKDFLKSELGSSLNDLDDGLAELVDRMSGIESALDPQKLKDRLENMGDFEEFIPTPAKVVPFHSETEILSQDGDVFFAGTFKNIGNAVLSVNAIPIVYQARFREQEMQFVRNEIESLISQIEQTGLSEQTARIKTDSTGDMSIEERILKEFIPDMLYSRKEQRAFSDAEEKLRIFLKQYRYPEDIKSMVMLILSTELLGEREYKLLELYAKKIGSISREDFSAAEKHVLSIQQLTHPPAANQEND